MTRRQLSTLALFAFAAACQKKEPVVEKAAAPPMFTGMTVNDSFRTPESVLYDEAGDRYIVSNINGAPTAKDNNGFLSIVNPSGRVDSLHFVQGGRGGVTLNAPKGLGISGDTIFVADIDELRMFSRTTGAPLGSVKVPGATFLNDVSVAPDGSVWFTDSGLNADFSGNGSDAVYHRDRTGLHKIAQGKPLGAPNGVYAESASAVVVTFASGEVYRVDLQGHRTALTKPPHGQLDGIIRLPGNHFGVSSWADSSVVSIPMTAPAAGASMQMAMVLVKGIPSPADIGFDTQRNRILIPVFSGNRLEIRPAETPPSPHAQK